MYVSELNTSKTQWSVHSFYYCLTLGLIGRPGTASPQPQQVLTKRRLQELLHEVDPREQMDDDVEDVSCTCFNDLSIDSLNFTDGISLWQVGRIWQVIP